MKLWRIFDARCRRFKFRSFVIVCSATAALTVPFIETSSSFRPPKKSSNEALDKFQEAPQSIYAENPNDPWNRIFQCLFTRRFEVRLSDDFSEGAPFTQLRKDSSTRVSTRVFERTEVGDRPIDPLYYPYPFSPAGSRQMLTEPMYSEFVGALREALSEKTQRSAIARAWMQSDLWAAHDILFWPLFPADRDTELDRHKQVVSDLLSKLIKRIALTSAEIKALPDNYAIAMGPDSLPDLFSKNSEWIEVQWFPGRAHDSQAGFRRVARVFIKPVRSPQDVQKLLSAVRDFDADSSTLLDGVALVVQPLLVDSRGELTPTHLTSEVQIRVFKRSNEGVLHESHIQVAELSRRLMLQHPDSGGLALENESSQAYLSAGGEYGFASSQFDEGGGAPVVVKLRTRCAFCHGDNLTNVMTFAIVRSPGPLRPVRQLDLLPIRQQIMAYHRRRNVRSSRPCTRILKRPDDGG